MIRTEIPGHNAFLLLIIINGEMNFDSTFAGDGCSFYLSSMYFCVLSPGIVALAYLLLPFSLQVL